MIFLFRKEFYLYFWKSLNEKRLLFQYNEGYHKILLSELFQMKCGEGEGRCHHSTECDTYSGLRCLTGTCPKSYGYTGNTLKKANIIIISIHTHSFTFIHSFIQTFSQIKFWIFLVKTNWIFGILWCFVVFRFIFPLKAKCCAFPKRFDYKPGQQFYCNDKNICGENEGNCYLDRHCKPGLICGKEGGPDGRPGDWTGPGSCFLHQEVRYPKWLLTAASRCCIKEGDDVKEVKDEKEGKLNL